jgi:DedD protein
MGLFSIFRKNKQEPDSSEGAFLSRAEEESNAIRGRGKRRQGDQPADPVLPEKKRARRRLVGAIALVLAMIIGLPMVLDSEPKPLADDIPIQIPSKDKPVHASADTAASQVPVAAPAAAQQAGSSSTSAAAVAPASVSASVVQDAAKDANKPATAVPEKEASVPPAAAKVASVAEVKLAPKSEAAASKPALNVDESARALAILEGRPEAAASHAKVDKKSDKFVIQVAALATQEKVNQLRGKLNEAGVKSYTQKVATESGPRIRVRVGPFGNKEEAEKIRAKLAKLGLKSSLVPGVAH